jgi:short-subunit dehydrogenase
MNVLITGACGGLGRALSGACAKRGYNLFLTDVDDRKLAALRSGLERQYDVLVATRSCDLTRDEDVSAMLVETDRCGFRFDMLLNVAGIDFEGGFMDRGRANILSIVSLNIEATLRITHAILERRKNEDRFYLVFVSSLASMYPMPLKATYAASKRFLLDFSIALGRELKDAHVKVMALCPAGLPTTPESIRGIAAQGFLGNITTCRLESVARNTVAHALRGSCVYIPGFVNKTICALGKLLPDRVIASLIHARWNGAQKKWLKA